MSETNPRLRAELEGIPTYKPGKPAAAGGPVAYKLSSNENPYPPLPGVMESVTAAAGVTPGNEHALSGAAANTRANKAPNLAAFRAGRVTVDVVVRRQDVGVHVRG